jgi:TRAP-type C4-dicarboxylate transport system permease small subunit
LNSKSPFTPFKKGGEGEIFVSREGILMSDTKKRIRIDHWIVAILLFAMASIAFVNVVSRYLLHFSFAATEEVTINLFVWITVIGSGIAFERGGQLGMITLYNIFPRKLKRLVIFFSSALSAILFLMVDIYMIQAIYDEMTLFHATSAALDIPVSIYYIGVPVFSVFVFTGIYRDASSKLDKLNRGEGK